MNPRLTASLASLSLQQPKLMTHVVLGYPTLEESLDVVRVMAESGAAFIELQIPFSDPMADGPTIMRANELALEQGVTPERCIEAMASLSQEITVPLLFMSYCNIVLGYRQLGLEVFCQEAAAAGAAGMIVPDVPREENREGYWNIAQRYSLTPISLVSPVTTDERMKGICDAAEGFIYCVATTGTTGARQTIPTELPEYLARVRTFTDLPLAVGFGISTPEHVAALSGHAEIAIVGSAMVDLITRTPKAERLTRVAEFTRALAG